MGSLWQDIRFGWLGLRATPATSAMAALVLAAGAVLNTTIIALVYGVLVRPLPYPDPSRLVLVPVGDRNDPNGGIRLSTFEDWRARMRVVERIAAYATTQYTVRGLGEPRVVQVALVTERFFEVLRVQPLYGRTLGSTSPTDRGIVLSERLARRLTIPIDKLVGQLVTVADQSFGVIGVAPEAVAFPSERVDMWVEATQAPAIMFDGEDARRFRLVARMAPGVQIEQVRDDATRVLTELRAERPDAFRQLVASADVLKDRLLAPVRPILLIFVIGAALVLLVACANAGSLLLARAVSRERDIAVRLALGGSRVRVVRAILAEASLIALVAACLGVGGAVAAVSVVGRLAAGALPRLYEVAIDWPVLLASLAVAGPVALVCGTAPALHALRTDVAPRIRQAGTSHTRGARRASDAFVVAQVATCVLLLIGASLLTRSVIGLLRVDLGIQPRNTLGTTLLLDDRVGFDTLSRRPFIDELTRQLEATKGVLHAGLGTSFPPHSSLVEVQFRIRSEGQDRETGLIGMASVTPGYFGALGIPLLAGRLLRDGDGDAGEPVAVISQSVAMTLFASQNPIGRSLPGRLPGRMTAPPRVVGVVGDVRYTGLDAPAGGTIYVPWVDLPAGVVHLAVRTTDTGSVGPAAIKSLIHRVDPSQPVGNIRPIDDVIADAVADRRLQALLVSTFAGFALFLAVFGLVAGLTRGVNERRRELAIRTALGLSPSRTVGLVLSNGSRLLAAGIAIGVATAALTAGGLAGMVYGLTPRDPSTYAAASGVVALLGLAGCYVPARRAAAISPAALLRSE